MEEETVLSDIMRMPPEFYRFEIINVLVLIVVGITLIVLTALEVVHIFLGVGLLAIMAGISSTASSVNFHRTRSSGRLGGIVAKSFKYRIASGIVCYIAGGALLFAYFVH
ncbi:MAG: hypothetical protein KAW09_09935 [Thermoplasmata archaeon]|nr:hypothetical protein [Thermoplasmata archaeon]